MHKVRFLFKNITLLNLLLIAVITMIANYAMMPYLNIQIRSALPARKKTIDQKRTDPSEFFRPSSSDYIVVSEENLFHPERKIPPEKKEEPPELPKPDLVLYGTLVSDVARVAYVEDLKAPQTTPGRGKRQTVLKVGDTVSGFIVKEVDTDKIIMVRGETRMVVPVSAPRKRKTEETARVPAQVRAPHAKLPLPAPEPSGKILIPTTPADERIRQFFMK
jgi:hypothetical protein